ncbi:hypothetical protein FRC07_004742 [Ceratobasidium sp. 392]|nr:hypothetical protein FRC07_004742 [Ceratobasidium sp. 392]
MSSPATGPKTSRRPGGRDRRSEPIEVRMSKTLSYILRHGAAKEGLAIRSDGYVRVTELVSLFGLSGLTATQPVVAQLARPKLKELNLPGLLKIVETDQKQRYQLGAQLSSPDEPIVPIPKVAFPDSTAVLWIRANQGHTLKVGNSAEAPVSQNYLRLHLEVDDLELKPVVTPSEVPCAVHGTSFKAWENIKSQGLSRMQRNHIHLASGRPGGSGVISGMRNSSQVLIFIDMQAAMAVGIPFQISTNGVILTSGDSSGSIPPEFFASVEQRTGSGWEPILVAGKTIEASTSENI